MSRRETCGDESRDTHGHARVCFLPAGHTDHGDPHMDDYGYRWHPVQVVLDRLQKRWEATHYVSFTGHMWLATARDTGAPWQTHAEPTPEQLEASLRSYASPPIPAQRSCT